ncbi:symmetrical bis(5'-nucleosyl)-tetraphosphatase [Buchnera aphidicola (Ceratovacuna keduensis)]|uniref:symmetrical bis(5'-nucleosyl)-tetraphosphatase n=1 Tax=Buchnera aphidicola TaxID=9 RepID=UPI0031B87B4E
MSTYFVGDIHGCFKQLKNLLNKVSFNFKKDTLWVTGDLVSKGPNSIEVLNFLYSNKKSIKIVLGNHDLNLIRLYFENILFPDKNNNFKNSDYNFKSLRCIIDWLRKQPIFRVNLKKKFVISHSGIPPKWGINLSKHYSNLIKKILSSNNYKKIFYILNMMFVNNCKWNNCLENKNNIKFAINGFTRMRYCVKKTYDLDLEYKNFPPENYKKNLIPWFLTKNKIPKKFSIIFGHWSSLNGEGVPKNFYAMDTGCCKGNKLTMLRWEDKKKFYESFY